MEEVKSPPPEKSGKTPFNYWFRVAGFVAAPLLLSSYVILFLFAYNLDTMSYDVVLFSLVTSIVATFIIWLLLFLVLRSGTKANVAVSALVVLFFSYGSVHGFFEEFFLKTFQLNMSVKEISTMVSIVLLPTWFVSAFLVLPLILKTWRNLDFIKRLLNIFATILICITLINIGWYELTSSVTLQSDLELPESEKFIMPENPPHIYHIILDGYARNDVLRDLYNYDNSELTNYLKEKGFFIAEKSHSNYNQTILSLGSALNLTYLDAVARVMGKRNNNRRPLKRLLEENRVFTILKKLGYKIAVFESGYTYTSFKGDIVDFYVKPGAIFFANEFTSTLYSHTILPEIARFLKYVDGSLSKPAEVNNPFLLFDSYDLHRRSVLFALDNLSDFAENTDPVFVFSHIVAPHPPFVFDENGMELNPLFGYSVNDGSHLVGRMMSGREYRESYVKQLEFINRKLMKALDLIFEKSRTPPIIILQSDHGPGSQMNQESARLSNVKERMSILNAYHFPGGGSKNLYSAITPVNSFKVMLNSYFGANYQLSADKSYFARWSRPYDFIDVSSRLQEEIRF